MKKGLIFATTLAMALGVGVAVGAHQNKAAETKAVAAGESVYLKPNDDWKSAGARFALYSWSGEGSNTLWTDMTAEAGTDYYKATIPSSAEKVIFCRMNGGTSANNWDNKWNQTSNLLLSESNGNIYKITGWDNSGEWDGGSYDIDDHPSEEGYYLLSSVLGWTFADGEKMVTCGSESQNYALIEGYTAVANEKINVRRYFDKTSYWCASDFTIETAGKKDIYLSKDGNIYVADHVDPEPEHEYKYSLNGAAGVVMSQNEQPGKETEYLSEELSFKKGDVLTFTKDNVAYAVSPKEDNQYTNVYPVEGGLKFAADYQGAICLETNGALLWAGQFEPGLYLAGLSGEWNPKLAMPATSGPNEDGAYYFSGIEFAANTEIKAVEFPNDSSSLNDHWLNADKDKVVADEGITFEVVAEGEGTGNLKVTSSGTYGVYANPSTGYYSLVDEEEHVYTVKVGATSYNLRVNEGSEYELDVLADKIELVHGTSVAVYKDGALDETFSIKEIGNNNLDAESNILATSEGQIYVDMSLKTLFVGGLPFGGYHLLKNDAVITMTHIDDFEGYIQYMAASVTFSAGDTIKFIDTNGGGEEHEYKNPAVVWPIGKVNTAGLGDHFEVVKNELQEVQYIRCIEACSTSVYMKIKSGLDEVYFGSVPEYIEQAIKFANDFEKAMAESCSAPAELKQSAVETAWAEAAADFAELSEDAQKELKLGNLSSQGEVREFGARYAGIYEQHAANWNLDEFLDWELTPNPAYNNANLITVDNNAIIIVISIVAASALAFTMLLVFKKRKQK